MDASLIDLLAMDVASIEPEVALQLPSDMWAEPWMCHWDVPAPLAGDPDADAWQPKKSPVSSQQMSSEEWDSEGAGSVTQSFNSAPSSCEESVGNSFNSIPPGAARGLPAFNGLPAKDKKPKKKPVPPAPIPSGGPDERDLDYNKYKTRLCRNWQQTGKCPYGEACVYAHGAKEVRGEQENEAVVSSLSKLADQMVKSMGLSGRGGMPPALPPLRPRKPKHLKKKAPAPAPAAPAAHSWAPPPFAAPVVYEAAYSAPALWSPAY